MSSKLVAATAALLVGTAALAHGGAEHAKGTVESVAADAIVVSTERGPRSFRVTSRTTVVKNGVVSAIGDVHRGDRVAVHAAVASPLEAERIVAGDAHGHGP